MFRLKYGFDSLNSIFIGPFFKYDKVILFWEYILLFVLFEFVLCFYEFDFAFFGFINKIIEERLGLKILCIIL